LSRHLLDDFAFSTGGGAWHDTHSLRFFGTKMRMGCSIDFESSLETWLEKLALTCSHSLGRHGEEAQHRGKATAIQVNEGQLAIEHSCFCCRIPLTDSLRTPYDPRRFRFIEIGSHV
jgi:hypothetical protein